MKISNVTSTVQKLDQQIKRSRNRLTDQILDKHIKCYINRLKVRSTDQKFDQPTKLLICRSKIRSIDLNLDQQLDSS